ncbi:MULTISPECIES: MFS transporter [unclassified Delftia]|uniref:MFS transporter n=1 Tax=unclassified Delftia TaxID=2613839 RepID=UPI000649116F|nr:MULTISPECIES: MFS transporter [unclassified Delftia]MDC2857902.1 MFS transporter [Delftia sp. DT-2]MPT04371.1 MFS transporter [Delftia sp.]
MKDMRAARWWGVISLFIIVAISYVDRINLSILILDQGFLDHIGLTHDDRTRQGLLATAFMVGYGVSSFVLTPFCAALFGVRRSLVVGLLLWGAVSFLSPAMNSYGLLLASRILLGISEGPLYSLAGSYIKAHFQSHENGLPNSFVNMGTGLGLAVGYPLIGYLVAGHDWQTSFHVLGLINVAIGIPLVLAFIRMPRVDTGMPRPRSLGEAVGQVGQIVRGAMHTRYLVLVAVLSAAFFSYLWGSSNWLPAYLESRGFSLREMGWLASLPQYATVLAVLVGGIVIDRLPRRQVPLIFVGGSLGLALAIWLAIHMEDRYAAAYCLIAANFCWGLMSPAIPSTVQYCARPEHVASAYGVVNGTATLVAGFMPALMGAVIGWTSRSAGGGFVAGFGLLVGTQLVVMVCGLVLWLRERGQGTHGASDARDTSARTA